MLEDRHRLRVVAREPLTERLLRIVRALHQRLARLVVEHRLRARRRARLERFGPLVLDVVRAARRLVHPPAADPRGQHRVGDLERNHIRHSLAALGEHRVEHRRLLDGAREPVEDEALRAVGVDDPACDHTDHERVGDKPARLHHRLGLDPDRRAGRDRRAQHVARRELWDAERLDDLRRLRALACAGRAEEDHNRALRRCDVRVDLLLRVASRESILSRSGDRGARAHPSGGWALRKLGPCCVLHVQLYN